MRPERRGNVPRPRCRLRQMCRNHWNGLDCGSIWGVGDFVLLEKRKTPSQRPVLLCGFWNMRKQGPVYWNNQTPQTRQHWCLVIFRGLYAARSQDSEQKKSKRFRVTGWYVTHCLRLWWKGLRCPEMLGATENVPQHLLFAEKYERMTSHESGDNEGPWTITAPPFAFRFQGKGGHRWIIRTGRGGEMQLRMFRPALDPYHGMRAFAWHELKPGWREGHEYVRSVNGNWRIESRNFVLR